MKIELSSLENKLLALKNAPKLKEYHDLGPRVFIRSSQPYELRVMMKNMSAMLIMMGKDEEYRLARNGLLVPRDGDKQNLRTLVYGRGGRGRGQGRGGVIRPGNMNNGDNNG